MIDRVAYTLRAVTALLKILLFTYIEYVTGGYGWAISAVFLLPFWRGSIVAIPVFILQCFALWKGTPIISWFIYIMGTVVLALVPSPAYEGVTSALDEDEALFEEPGLGSETSGGGNNASRSSSSKRISSSGGSRRNSFKSGKKAPATPGTASSTSSKFGLSYNMDLSSPETDEAYASSSKLLHIDDADSKGSGSPVLAKSSRATLKHRSSQSARGRGGTDSSSKDVIATKGRRALNEGHELELAKQRQRDLQLARIAAMHGSASKKT